MEGLGKNPILFPKSETFVVWRAFRAVKTVVVERKRVFFCGKGRGDFPQGSVDSCGKPAVGGKADWGLRHVSTGFPERPVTQKGDFFMGRQDFGIFHKILVLNPWKT